MTTRTFPFTVTLTAALALAACGGGNGSTTDRAGSNTTEAKPVIDVGDKGDYHPEVDPANFVDTVTNPYLPWTPGSTWVYEGIDDGKHERVEVTVTDEHKDILGINAVVVHDQGTVGGKVTEDTFDWYAQDRDGNVWYLGEDTTSYEEETPSKEGSWQAGVDGAQPGIVMPAHPKVGDAYRQEYLKGLAEDVAEVRAVDGHTDVPTGSYDNVLVTREWTRLEPDIVEEKMYASGVGEIRETITAGGEGDMKLVEYTPGS